MAVLNVPEGRQPLVDADVEAQKPGSDFAALRQLSQKVNSNADASHMTMEWSGVTFGIGDKTILKNVTGLVEPKKLTCVLGPSGSGKSTLMNVLAGRQNTRGPGMTYSATVTANGVEIDPPAFRSNVAYVMQDDSLLGTETPQECLDFSSNMRLPKTVTKQERDQLVSDVLDTLHLTKCKDTLVGNALIKGISGGERKRTSVGVELISNPKLLFLDEPLSGLDSYAAFTLVEALKELSDSGVPVMCTVHQPSSEIFDIFDDVIILHDGEVVYHGAVSALLQYFEELGYPCKPNFNPADHVMFLLQKEPAEAIRKVKDNWPKCELFKCLQQRVSELQSNKGALVMSDNSDANQQVVGTLGQVGVLLAREARALVRNKGMLGARYGMTIFLTLLYGWLFAGTGRAGDKEGGSCVGASYNPTICATEFQAHLGSLLSLAIATMMGSAQPVLLTFPSERPVFLREYAANMYGATAYFIAKTMVELPVLFTSALLQFLVGYWFIGLRGDFVFLVLVSWLLSLASASLALCVGCSVASVDKAIQLAPLTLLPQMLFSGLFIPIQSIPASLQWVQYLCPLKYAINLLGMTEFWYVHEKLADGPGYVQRNILLQRQAIKFDEWEFNLLLLVALFFFFRIVACIMLWRKGRYVY